MKALENVRLAEFELPSGRRVCRDAARGAGRECDQGGTAGGSAGSRLAAVPRPQSQQAVGVYRYRGRLAHGARAGSQPDSMGRYRYRGLHAATCDRARPRLRVRAKHQPARPAAEHAAAGQPRAPRRRRRVRRFDPGVRRYRRQSMGTERKSRAVDFSRSQLFRRSDGRDSRGGGPGRARRRRGPVDRSVAAGRCPFASDRLDPAP